VDWSGTIPEWHSAKAEPHEGVTIGVSACICSGDMVSGEHWWDIRGWLQNGSDG